MHDPCRPTSRCGGVVHCGVFCVSSGCQVMWMELNTRTMDRSRLTRLNLNAPNIMKWKLWRAASALHSPYYGSLWEWRRHRASNQSFCATRAAGCTPPSKHVSLLMYVRTSHFWLLWIRVRLQIMREWVLCPSGARHRRACQKELRFFSCGQKFDSCRSICGWFSPELAHSTVKIDTHFAAIYYLAHNGFFFKQMATKIH